MTNLSQSFFKSLIGYSISGSIRVISVIIGFLLTLAISTRLNSDDAGTFFLILSILTISSFVLTFGREYVVLRETATSNVSNSFINNFLYISKISIPPVITAFLLSALFFYITSNVYYLKSIYLYKVILFTIPALTGITIISFAIQGQSRISLSILTSRILCPFFLILVFYLNLSENINHILNFYLLIAWLCFFITFIFFCLNNSKEKFVHQKKNLHETNNQKLYLFIIGVCQQIFIWQGTLLTSIFFQNDDIAIITITQRTSVIISFILITINAVNAPKFARLYSNNDIVGMRKLAYSSRIISLLFGCLVAFFIFLYSEDIILLFGEEYLNGTRKLRILIIGQLFTCLAGPVGIILLMSSKFKESALSSILSLLTAFLFAYFFSGSIGLNSIPIAIVLSLFLKNSMDLYFTVNLLRNTKK